MTEKEQSDLRGVTNSPVTAQPQMKDPLVNEYNSGFKRLTGWHYTFRAVIFRAILLGLLFHVTAAICGIWGLFGFAETTQYLTLDAFSAYTDSQDTQWMNQENLNKNTQEWEGNATAEFKSLFKGFQDMQDYQTQNSYAVGNLTELYSNQQDQISEITRQTAAGINNVQQQLRSHLRHLGLGLAKAVYLANRYVPDIQYNRGRNLYRK